MSEMPIIGLKGIGEKKAKALMDAGFLTIDDIQRASLEELTRVEGIGEKQAIEIKRQVEMLRFAHEEKRRDETYEINENAESQRSNILAERRAVYNKSLNRSRKPFYLAMLVALIFVAGVVVGSIVRNEVLSQDVDKLQEQTTALEEQLALSQTNQTAISYYYENISLSELYQHVNDAIVGIHAYEVQTTFFGTYYSEVGGSGFIYNFSGRYVVITNYHVVHGTVNITVTLADGNAYSASVIGSDPYADLAVLDVDFEDHAVNSLSIASSSTLEVGDPVIAIGNPFGLEGTMTTGIVSQLERTIQESTAGSFSIANIIQISTAINPGNSGGPLMNYRGEVVGITTAIIEDSEGLGFAIPSNTILRELPSLITTGSYNLHAWVGVSGKDMTYEISQAMHINVTYGWLIAQVVGNGPADQAGIQGGSKQVQIFGSWTLIGGDVIIAIDNTTVVNGDMFMSYLEKYIPGQVINLTIIRNNQTLVVPVELGERALPE